MVGIHRTNVIIKRNGSGHEQSLVYSHHIHFKHGGILVACISLPCREIGHLAFPIGAAVLTSFVIAHILVAIGTAAFRNLDFATVLHETVADIGLGIGKIAGYTTHIVTPSMYSCTRHQHTSLDTGTRVDFTGNTANLLLAKYLALIRTVVDFRGHIHLSYDTSPVVGGTGTLQVSACHMAVLNIRTMVALCSEATDGTHIVISSGIGEVGRTDIQISYGSSFNLSEESTIISCLLLQPVDGIVVSVKNSLKRVGLRSNGRPVGLIQRDVVHEVSRSFVTPFHSSTEILHVLKRINTVMTLHRSRLLYLWFLCRSARNQPFRKHEEHSCHAQLP